MKNRYISLALAALVLVGCGNRKQVKEERVISVGVIEIGEAQQAFNKSYDGSVESARRQLILAPHSGTVSSLSAKVGQSIREGKVFVHIDAPDVKSLHDANQATLRQAKDGYERAKKVYEAGGLTEIKWMEIETKLAQAVASAEISDRSLAKCDIKSPFTGTVSEIYVSLGQSISMGERIAELIDEGDLNVSIEIPETEYTLVQNGTKAKVCIPALDGLELEGKIISIGVNTRSLSHSYTAQVQLRNKPSTLKPGMICKVYLQHSLEDRLEIPASVVKVDEGGNYVWMVDSDNIVRKRYVTTGQFVGKGVAIKSGLESGDLVIVDGMSKVSTGMKAQPNKIER